jgi:hypothetical protein
LNAGEQFERKSSWLRKFARPDDPRLSLIALFGMYPR